jgi:hypothetical protein
MKIKIVRLVAILALILAMAIAIVPASPAQAAPMDTITLSFTGTSFWGYNYRPHNLQPGDEVIQFTRANIIVGSNPTGSLLVSMGVTGTVSGDLSGTLGVEWNGLGVECSEFAPNTGKGYLVGKGTFNDGHGNTVTLLMVADSDYTLPSPGVIDQSFTGYAVSIFTTGAFSGQKFIGNWSGSAVWGPTPSASTTATLRRYSSSEVSGPYPISGTATDTPGNGRAFGPSTGPNPDDEFIQFSRENIVIPKDAPAWYIEGGSANGTMTGVLSGTTTQTYNHINIPGTPSQGLSVGKLTAVNASGTVSGVFVYDLLESSGAGYGSGYVYMFALRENATGAYAGKDFYAEATATSTAGLITSSGNLYIMEPQVAGSTVSGTITVSDGTVSGTYNTTPPYETLTGSATVSATFSGDISGTSTFEGTYDVSDQSMHGTAVPAPCTLTMGGVPHTAMIYGKSTTTNFVVGPPGYPNPSPVTFDMLIAGSIWTTDGSNIYVYVTGAISGNATYSWPAPGQYQMTDFTASGTWTGTAQNLETAPQVSDVTPGAGTVTLSGAQGTVAQLNYETTGSGTILLAQYEGNPGGTPVKTPLGKYVEVDSSIISSEITWPVELRVYYTDAEVAAAGVDENSLRMYRWNGSSWEQVAESGVNTSQNYVWANLYSFSPYGPMGNPLGGGGGAASVPVFPNIYVGIAAALAAGVIAYFLRRRLVRQE